MKKLLSIFLIVASACVFSQNLPESTSLFSKNLNTLYKNPSQTIRVAKYLYENATTNKEKAKALYLLSESKKLQGNYIESIDALFEAKALLSPTEDHFISTLVLISIAERCRISGINDISNQYLQQARTHINKIRSKEEMIIAKARLLHEQTDIQFQSKRFPEAIKTVKKAESLLDDIKTSQASLLIKNYILQGALYIQENNPDNANLYYKKAMDILKESSLQESSLEAETLKGIGTLQYNRKEYLDAEKNLKKGLAVPVIEKPVKIELLNKLSQIYKEKDSMADFQEHYKESSRLSASLLASERKVRNTVLSQIEKEQEGAINQDKKSYYLGGAIILAVLIAAFFAYFFYNKKLDKEYQQFEKVISQIENKEKLEISKAVVQEESKETKGVIIPEETENAILQRLENFETTTKYTNSNMSLSLLAKQMQTNTKYISEIIHTHKNKNFNTYINELRINHIIQLMKEDKKYLNYKVSYLAEESGFSSHSAFTVVFKSITGITPKQFISFLKKDDKVAS